MLLDRDKCILCGNCVRVCPQGAVKIVNNVPVTDMDKCAGCRLCEVYCLPGARELVGREYTVEEIMKELTKDKVFYRQSNGGVTLSGGEPLTQIDFVEELLKQLKKENIHTAVDTCGAVSFENIRRVAAYTDVFLYDLKLMDDKKHEEYVGASNKLILDNLKKLSEIHKNINLRMPIIEGVNADVNHIEETLNFIKGLNITNVNLLPYHDIAKHKYKKMNLSYEGEGMSVPSEEKMQSFKEMFEKEGYKTKIGG